MRVLFSSSPGLGHLFPMIPLAWALRSAGHEVLVTTTSDAVLRAAQAGLPAVEVAPQLDVEEFFASAVSRRPDPESMRRMLLEQPEMAFKLAAQMFGELGDQLADGTLAAARAWRPDLVVFEQMDSAGPFAAMALGIPFVQFNFGKARGTDEVAQFAASTAAYDRHGVARPVAAAAIINPATASLGAEQLGWPVRYVPYNAGGVLPEWLLGERTRPRVCVTLGTVVTKMMGIGALGRIVDAARKIDAEFVFALGDADASVLGDLPENVRIAGWIPLNALLEQCDAIVHHGGSGSTFTSLFAGVPQLVLPHGADQFENAKMLRDAGIGLWPEESTVDASHIAQLLEDKEMLAACERFRAENAARPAPAELVAKLAALVG